jgi:hypothetical protein
MKASIRGSKNQYDYCPDRRADRTQETEIVGIRVKHTYRQASSQRQSAPVSKNRAEHQENRKTRTEAADAATNAMAEEISRENAQLG